MKENLKLIGVFHLVLGGIGVLFSLFPLMYVLMGIMFLNNDFPPPEHGEHQEMPKEFGYMMIGMGSIMVLFGEFCSIVMIVSGVFILKLKHRMFSLVVGGIECMAFPFGTVLGVFTLVNLSNDEVKELYARD